MKKVCTLLIAVAAFLTATAQQVPMAQSRQLQKATSKPDVCFTGEEAVNVHPSVPGSESQMRNVESTAGESKYDLQANASDNTRLINRGNGDIRAIWTYSDTPGAAAPFGWADRGMAYNSLTAGSWGAYPTDRVENGRTGFGSMCITPAGTEFILSHRAVATGQYLLHTAKRPVAGGAWVNGTIPTALPNGYLWPRVAAGSGNTIHAIALTTPTGTAFGGVSVNDKNGDILYFRSKDGGATWDKKDVALPGNDATVFSSHGGESYVIDADGDNVVIGIFPFLQDIVFYKSADGGDTWTRHTVYNSPLNNYEFDTGYTPTDIDLLDPNIPVIDAAGTIDSVAVWTTDEHGAIRIDAAGMVHVAYSGGYMSDNEVGITGFNWYPTSGRIWYWNEGMGEDDTEKDGFIPGFIIGAGLDYNGDSTLNVANADYNGYGASFSASQPTMGLNTDANSVYVAYSAADERFIESDITNQHFRHVHIVKSNDGGTSWTDPYDVVTEANQGGQGISEFTEAAFPFLARNCNDAVHLIYQSDFYPGSGVTDAVTSEDQLFCTIVYNSFDDAELGTISQKDVLTPSQLDISLSPNPASEMLQVELAMFTKTGELNVAIFDMNGKLVFEENRSDNAADRLFIPVRSLKNGLYSLTVRTEKGLASKKFTVIH